MGGSSGQVPASGHPREKDMKTVQTYAHTFSRKSSLSIQIPDRAPALRRAGVWRAVMAQAGPFRRDFRTWMIARVGEAFAPRRKRAG
jgi:hypothetical protein